MTTTDTIQTAQRHGLPIPAFARNEHAPGRATCYRGWVKAVELLDEATTEAGANAARRLADYYAGPAKRPVTGRAAIRVQPEQTTRPDREF
ncbi:hypothetical protein [Xanthobacter autotrophicus]|uniref:hypothetical protein n=1 Tax=Xanthobacter autotrophicus TaxID=280 RepID=UPI00372C3D41